jgi:hypothetical protein
LRINIYERHIFPIILQVSTIMEVPPSRSQIGPCLKQGGGRTLILNIVWERGGPAEGKKNSDVVYFHCKVGEQLPMLLAAI